MLAHMYVYYKRKVEHRFSTTTKKRLEKHLEKINSATHSAFAGHAAFHILVKDHTASLVYLTLRKSFSENMPPRNIGQLYVHMIK